MKMLLPRTPIPEHGAAEDSQWIYMLWERVGLRA